MAYITQRREPGCVLAIGGGSESVTIGGGVKSIGEKTVTRLRGID